MNNFNPKQIEFKFGDYISQGFELFKKDIWNFVVAYIFVMIMSMIPFCNIMAVGNFYKYCRKKNRGEEATPSEIFNFDQFGTYFILNLIIIGLSLFIAVPYFMFIGSMATLGETGEVSAVSSGLSMISGLSIFVGVIVIYYLMLKAFYITGLISLEGENDWKKAWEKSKIMTKNNLLMILLFVFVISSIAQLGIMACCIGIFLTMPLSQICSYVATEDGLNQIKNDEINEIGITKSY